MRSVLSALKSGLSRAFGSDAAYFVDSSAGGKTEESPRLMVEAPGQNPFGRALLYVPREGLFTVHADGTATSLRSISLMHREGKDVIFPMRFPLGDIHTIRFAGPDSRSTYYYRDDEGVELVELSQGTFEVVETPDPKSTPGHYQRLYMVRVR